MTRRYDMRQRGQVAAQTRAAVLDAAHALLDDPEGGGLSLNDVARAAGVTRATIYNQFGSRPALLSAVFVDTGRRIRYERVQQAMALPDARSALRETLRELARAWSTSRRILRRTLALAALDTEIGAEVERFEGYRRQEMSRFTARLADAGLLRPGLKQRDAEAIVATLTGFVFFDALWDKGTARDAAARLVQLTGAALGIDLEKDDTDGTDRR